MRRALMAVLICRYQPVRVERFGVICGFYHISPPVPQPELTSQDGRRSKSLPDLHHCLCWLARDTIGFPCLGHSGQQGSTFWNYDYKHELNHLTTMEHVMTRKERVKVPTTRLHMVSVTHSTLSSNFFYLQTSCSTTPPCLYQHWQLYHHINAHDRASLSYSMILPWPLLPV
jgi:hypothetical protein